MGGAFSWATMETEPKRSRMGDLCGAFADGAVLFPLLVALTIKTGMNGTVLLATAGLAYITAGWVFRVPMSVQPLKSVVVAAVALGATAAEVSLSGAIAGILCLSLSFFSADAISARVPRHLVHGLQMGLGLLLMIKGVEAGWSGGFHHQLGFLALALMALIASRFKIPLLGGLGLAGIAIGLVVSIFHPDLSIKNAPPVATVLRLDILAALVLPQMALTLANSVIGTHDVAVRYFGEAAAKVTPTRLLRSIGIGNILVAPLGGLPFCHGAGGVTAHVRGGAHSWRMNLVIGGSLLALALISALMVMPLLPAYPPMLMGALLAATGWFHLRLAEPSWKQQDKRIMLVLMGLTALVSQNMLWVLAIGIAGEFLRKYCNYYFKEVK